MIRYPIHYVVMFFCFQHVKLVVPSTLLAFHPGSKLPGFARSLLINNFIALYFEKYGFSPDQACTFADAKKLLLTQSYDLISLDWQLSDKKVGFDLLPFIETHTKILLISAMPEFELRQAVQAHEQIDDFLSKTFKGEALAIKARALLDVW